MPKGIYVIDVYFVEVPDEKMKDVKASEYPGDELLYYGESVVVDHTEHLMRYVSEGGPQEAPSGSYIFERL